MQRSLTAVKATKPDPQRTWLHITHFIRVILLLLYIAGPTNSTPISAPDTFNKSANIGSTSSSASLMIKSSAHDAQLNSLNAYAINYGQMAAESSNNAAQSINTNNFKPSYKLPELENNFTPIQTQSSAIIMPHASPLTAVSPNINGLVNNNIQQPTPVLMQYIPQAVQEAGIHYFQLIPTRPLIVPITSYLNGNAAPPTAAQTVANEPLHRPLTAAINSGALDYAARTPPILTPKPINSSVVQQQLKQQQHPISGGTQTLIDVSHTAAAQPYGLQTYANTIQPYRSSYRINREVKGKNFLGTMTLNMNEYIPGPNEALRPLYVRGRS
ncbi:uncharacterized protein [Eurosta solidaginis]